MSRIYTEREVVALVPGLTGARLVQFIEIGIVLPVERGQEPGFQRLDLARLELACELADQFELGGEALTLVLSLVDQLHAKRAELRAVLEAVEAQPPATRARIAKALQAARGR